MSPATARDLGKAGISWAAQEPSGDPVAKFFQPGSRLTWWYNWDKVANETSPGLEIDAEYVPMIWKPSYLSDGRALETGWEMLLGYNEPDQDDSVVAACVPPDKAARAWVELAKLRTSPNIKLISPAVASDIDWLKTFFSLIPDEAKPDYMAVHFYGTTFEAFKARVEMFWQTFKMPVIVTEFAMHSFDPNVPPPKDQQQVHDFMGQTTKWLDDTEYIVRYAWFLACTDPLHLHGVHPFNRLMDDQGELTPLGDQYVNGGHA